MILKCRYKVKDGPKSSVTFLGNRNFFLFMHFLLQLSNVENLQKTFFKMQNHHSATSLLFPPTQCLQALLLH